MNRVHIGKWVARVAYICLYRNRFWKMDTMHGMHMYAQRPFEKIGRQAWEAQVCKKTASGTSGMVYASVHRNRFKRLDIAPGMHMYAQKLFQKHQAWYTQVCTVTVSEIWTSGAGQTCCHGTAARGEGEHQKTVEVCPRPGGYAPHA